MSVETSSRRASLSRRASAINLPDGNRISFRTIWLTNSSRSAALQLLQTLDSLSLTLFASRSRSAAAPCLCPFMGNKMKTHVSDFNCIVCTKRLIGLMRQPTNFKPLKRTQSVAIPHPIVLLERFSRRTRSTRFIPEVDGLRFVAIFLVFVFHLHGYLSHYGIPENGTDWVPMWITNGRNGVEIFFLISGFVLALPFASALLKGTPWVPYSQYLLRRITRLEPPYIIVMVGLAILLVLTKGRPVEDVLPHLAAALGYLHNAVYLEGTDINGVAWSLEVEVQFYLIAPLLAFVFFRIGHSLRRRLLLLGAATFFAAANHFWFRTIPFVKDSVAAYMHFFLLGFLLVDLYLSEWKQDTRRSFRWDVAWLLSWVALTWAWGTSPAAVAGVLPVAAFVIFAGALRGHLVRNVLSNRWITTIGGMCYSIYLLHYAVISAVTPLALRLTGRSYTPMLLITQTILVGLIVLIISGIFFLAIERPCMDPTWPDKLRSWLRSLRATPSTRQGSL